MVSRIQLDLTDPLILSMADSHHVPTEAWTPGGYVVVTCAECRQEWPCLTRQQLTALTASKP
jgi:hypothetical protein